MKNLKVLIIFLIATTSSGCSIFKGDLIEPLCLPERPLLEDVTVAEQRAIKEIDSDLLRRIGENDAKLKTYIRTTEGIVDNHNEQFKAKCFGDTE